MRRTATFIVCATSTLAYASWLLVRHLVDLSTAPGNLAISYAVMFAYLVVTVTASFAARPHRLADGVDLDAITADIVTPIYNEAPELLAAGLCSYASQSRLPRAAWLIDDGSDDHVLEHPLVLQAIANARAAGIRIHTHRQINHGKRHAQAYAFARSDADIYVTVDSDTILRNDAIANLLVPFSRPESMCVGGVAVGQNRTHSILTRVVELGFVMAFLSGRAAEGCFGSVRVNCGIIAAYRGWIVRANLERYLNQRFLGRIVKTGDDRALTIYCKEHGRAEFQPAAVGYTALPVTFSHLVRQRVRWARSWYWGSAWLLRRKLTSADFVLTFLQVCGMVMYLLSIVFAIVGTAVGAIAPRLLFWTVVTSITVGMFSTMRYVVAARPEDSLASRLVTWLLSPLSSLLYMFLLVPLYWYAAATMRSMGWGTRETIEVNLHKPAVLLSGKEVLNLDPQVAGTSRSGHVAVLHSGQLSATDPRQIDLRNTYHDVASEGRN